MRIEMLRLMGRHQWTYYDM